MAFRQNDPVEMKRSAYGIAAGARDIVAHALRGQTFIVEFAGPPTRVVALRDTHLDPARATAVVA